MNANIDFITPSGGGGEIGIHMAQNQRLDPQKLRPWYNPKDGLVYLTTYRYKGFGDPDKIESYEVKHTPKRRQPDEIGVYGTLRRDEWKQLDDAVQDICRIRLNGIADLEDKGLTYPLGNAMGTTVLEWHSMREAMEAAITMDGVNRTTGDRTTYKTHYLPIPIISCDFEINTRVLEASRSIGNPLDTDNVEQAVIKVNEQLESLLFTNTSYAFGETDDDARNSIYSYLSHPDRNQYTITVADWAPATASGPNILVDVLGMIQASVDAKHYGPWMLYIPTAYQTTLGKDYEDTYPGSIGKRLMEIEGLQGIKVVDTLTTGNVLLVEMLKRTTRLVTGGGIQVVQWKTEGEFVNKFKVYRIAVPQVRADAAGNSGVVHGSA